MFIRVIKLLKGILKVRNHLLNLFPAPAIFALKDVNSEAPVGQNLC